MKAPRAGTIFLVLWGLFLASGAFAYLRYFQPSRLGATVGAALESTMGAASSIESAHITFFPEPAILIQGVALRFETPVRGSMRAESCRAELSWKSIFLFRPVLGSLDMDRPVLDIVLPSPPAGGLSAPGLDAAGDLPPALAGLNLAMTDGSLRLKTEDGSREIRITGLTGKAHLPSLLPGSLELDAGSVAFFLSNVPDITAGNVRMELSTRATLGGEREGSLYLKANAQMASPSTVTGKPIRPEYAYFPLPEPAKLEAHVQFSQSPDGGTLQVEGLLDAEASLPMNGHPTPLAIRLPFSASSPDNVAVKRMELNADQDRLVFSGALTGLARKDPVFNGRVDIERFSLTRWFGFGRKMSAGLQIALNDIAGSLDGVVLTPRGVKAARLEARTMGLTLAGHGACEDFLKPNIEIAGHIDSGDLNPVFPEINGRKTPKPELPPPAVPLQDDGKPSSIGYDIHLTAGKADILKWSVGGVDCRITPIPPARIQEAGGRPGGAMLAITVADVYGGTGQSTVYLHDKHRILAQLANVSLEEPVVRTAGFAAFGGRMQARADLTLFGDSPASIMGNLSGTLDATLRQGFFGSAKGARAPYEELTVQASAKAAPASRAEGDLPPAMDFSGLWDINLKMKDWSIATRSNLTMTFSMKNGLPSVMKPQPATFQVRLGKSLGNGAWPQDIALTLAGQAAFDIAAENASLAQLTANAPDLALGGSLRLEHAFSQPVFAGRLRASTDNLRAVAALFGQPLPATTNAALLSHMDLEADASLSGPRLELNNMTGTLDTTSVAGSLSAELSPRPSLKGHLSLGSVNLDDYLPPPSPEPTIRPLPLDFLLGRDADLTLACQRLVVWRSPVLNLKAPFALKDGALRLGPLEGAFPGRGALDGQLEANISGPAAQNGRLQARLRLNAAHVDMLALSQNRAQETLVAGDGSAVLEIQATMLHWNDIPAQLDGNWSVTVRDGYVVNAKEDLAHQQTPPPPQQNDPVALGRTPAQAVPVSPRTNFQTLSASGTLLAGVVQSSNFQLKSPALSITGGGTINLNTQSIAANVVATLLGVPEVPIEIHGSLHDPQTSYKFVGAVTGTLGNIGGTVVDIVTGVLTAPFKIFSGK